jgi:hypothetical protein
VHSALEDLYKLKSDTVLMDKKQLLEAFEKHWNSEILEANEVS